MNPGSSLMTFFLLVSSCQIAIAQSLDSVLRGVGIEIGVGHNNLFWSAPFTIKTVGGTPVDRTHIFLTLNIRVNYRIPLSDRIALVPFLGYNRFGGASAESEGFHDSYSFDVLEFGSFVLYRISNFRFGPGIKLNYHLRARFDLDPTDTWHRDRSTWFAKWSEDAGLRVSYDISHFCVALESWFGLGNLANGPLARATVRENHYRFLVGYTYE